MSAVDISTRNRLESYVNVIQVGSPETPQGLYNTVHTFWRISYFPASYFFQSKYV